MPPRWRTAAMTAAMALLIVPNLSHLHSKQLVDVDPAFWTPQQLAIRGFETTTMSEVTPRWIAGLPAYSPVAATVHIGRRGDPAARPHALLLVESRQRQGREHHRNEHRLVPRLGSARGWTTRARGPGQTQRPDYFSGSAGRASRGSALRADRSGESRLRNQHRRLVPRARPLAFFAWNVYSYRRRYTSMRTNIVIDDDSCGHASRNGSEDQARSRGRGAADFASLEEQGGNPWLAAN